MQVAQNIDVMRISPEMVSQIDRANLDKMRDMVLARFAQVTMSFMGVPRYSHQSIKELQALAMVPLMRERIAIATVAPKMDNDPASFDSKPAGAGSISNPLIGIALWANVSAEVDAKIRDQAAAGIFPVKLNPDDWISGDIVWLLDVIAPSQKLSAQVMAAFKQVLAAKLPDRTSGDVKLHPIIKKMIGEDVLKQMGARSVAGPSDLSPQVTTRTVTPKKKKTPAKRSSAAKKKVN